MKMKELITIWKWKNLIEKWQRQEKKKSNVKRNKHPIILVATTF